EAEQPILRQRYIPLRLDDPAERRQDRDTRQEWIGHRFGSALGAGPVLAKRNRNQPPLSARCAAGLARRDRVLAAVIVEAAFRLAAEPARLDVFHEQRTRAVLRIRETFVQDLHDREAD